MAKIVFCEDEAYIQKLIRVTLRHSGHDLFMAADGEEGWVIIQREHPDMVFTDISMPHCDGYRLVEKIRQHDAFAQLPVVFLTAFGEQPERLEGFRLGAIEYLTKPFSPKTLRDKIALLAQTSL
jgi:two-component system, OmpR family, response regulator ResD